MTLFPLLDASLAIKIHVITITPAVFIGAYVLAARKGTALHRLLGRLWLILMFATALSSLFIHQLNWFYGFSPIHLLSLNVLTGSVMAVVNVRRGQIEAHKRTVKGLYFGGIVGAGIFTLLPGRIMNEIFLTSLSGLLALCLVLMLVALCVQLGRSSMGVGSVLRSGK